MEFKDKLKNRRLELGLTLVEVAKAVGVSAPTIQRYESGDIKNIRKDKIKALADALQLTPTYLMGWEEMRNGYQPRVRPESTEVQRPWMKYPTFWEYSGMKKWKAINAELNLEMNNAATKQDFKNMLRYAHYLVESDTCPACNGNLVNEWTPIKREWPSKPGTYLVTYREWSNGEYLPKFDETYVRILRYSQAIFRLPVCIDPKAEADTNREVLAWMELPEIYKEVK